VSYLSVLRSESQNYLKRDTIMVVNSRNHINRLVEVMFILFVSESLTYTSLIASCSVLGVPSEELLMLWMLLMTNVSQRNFPTVSGQLSADDGAR